MKGEQATQLAVKYDRAAPKWHDKMRALGYYDGYLGFLSAPGHRNDPRSPVLDVGCGSGSFAEAWVAVHGAPSHLTLLDPSLGMLKRAGTALASYDVQAHLVEGLLCDQISTATNVLAAHVIEHCPDVLDALKTLRNLILPGGQLYLVVSKPHWCNAIIWLQWRHRTFSQESIETLLSEAGLAIKSTYAFPSGPPSRTSMGIVAVRREDLGTSSEGQT